MRYNDSSVRLSGGENRLELRFRPCEASGLLLYATSKESSGLYFALGLYSSQLLIEFTDETGLKEVTVCADITCHVLPLSPLEGHLYGISLHVIYQLW